jgi:methionyl-tRNA formyltransferase
MKMTFSPVKEYALSQNLQVYQPLKMRDGEAMAIVEQLQPELIVVAAYGRILPEEILNAPKYGSINVHSSLLPKYRGAAPINWAILDGLDETGVTIMYMAKELDAGDIIHTVTTPIDPQETALELTMRLAQLGAQALVEAVDMLRNGTAARTPQDHSAHTYAPMLSKALSPIDWNRSAKEIHNQVRGLIPWPCASTQVGGKNVKVFCTEIGSATAAPAGTVVAAGKQGIEIACGDGKTLLITQLQAEGGKRMAAADYLRGHSVQVGV